MPAVKLSIVVPLLNEAPCVSRLHRDLLAAVQGLDVEILTVDDGSSDDTLERLRSYPEFRVVALPHGGKTEALRHGFALAMGTYVATIDADLQEDPAALKEWVALLDAGADCVSAVRVGRLDGYWQKRIPSWCFNALLRVFFRTSIRDLGCGFRLYRRSSLSGLPWFEGVYRYLPLLMQIRGDRVIERPVVHHPRIEGKAKFNSPLRGWTALKSLHRLHRSLSDLQSTT